MICHALLRKNCLGTDKKRRWTYPKTVSVGTLKKVVHSKSDFILAIFAKRVHTKHGMAQPFADGKIDFRV